MAKFSPPELRARTLDFVANEGGAQRVVKRFGAIRDSGAGFYRAKRSECRGFATALTGEQKWTG